VSPKTLLVVNRADGSDSPLRAALSEAGFSVFSGCQAVSDGPFDLVIADVPHDHEEASPALAGQLRQAYPSARVLFLSREPLCRLLASGSLDPADFAGGRSAFLRGPQPFEVLITRAWNLLDRPVTAARVMTAV
jgi:hypothetical protein